jgi:multicomponent Na+:H+ antiporter subunit B
MKSHLILSIVAKFLIPLVLLFAFYVQFHGDFGPGGGFQAGVIFAAAVILHLLVFGHAATEHFIPTAVLKIGAALGVLIYAGVGVASLLAGGRYLDYDVLADNAVAGQHLGILLVEAGVGITVAAVMILLAYSFQQRGHDA